MFSGIGGFELGILLSEHAHFCTEPEAVDVKIIQLQLGDKSSLCVGFSEIDKYAVQIYKRHFPNHKEYGDVTKIDWSVVPDFDLLVGGVPCQAWSIAGKRKGFEDSRGTMWFEYFRCIKEKQPRFFLAENVKGILSHAGGESFIRICEIFCGLGYAIDFEVLNSKCFGVPQNRERVFIVGIRDDLLDECQIF